MTYSIRSVVLSNSILVVTPQSSTDTVVICDQVNEILELTPAVPKLHKLAALLRRWEYDDVQDSEDQLPAPGGLTYAMARATIQASDAELARGLRQQRILDIHGALRPIAPAYLVSILETILNFLVSQSLSTQRAVPEEDVAATLADENEISRAVSTQVMQWFGELREGAWTMDVDAVVREIGLGILRQHKVRWGSVRQILNSMNPRMSPSRKKSYWENGNRQSGTLSRRMYLCPCSR
jgi:sister chromatid cohesion protein DCC1